MKITKRQRQLIIDAIENDQHFQDSKMCTTSQEMTELMSLVANGIDQFNDLDQSTVTDLCDTVIMTTHAIDRIVASYDPCHVLVAKTDQIRSLARNISSEIQD